MSRSVYMYLGQRPFATQVRHYSHDIFASVISQSLLADNTSVVLISNASIQRARMGNHALVFGGTGIQGWAVVNQILNGYPFEDAFDKVTALTNRPVTEKMLWPESKKLQTVSGINLLTARGQQGLEKEMKEKIPSAESVTHMFFFGTIWSS